MPFAPTNHREPRNVRLLKLLLLQAAILSITGGCAGGQRSAHESDERLKASLDAMSDRMAATGGVIVPATFLLDERKPCYGEPEYTATSSLDTGRLPEEPK